MEDPYNNVSKIIGQVGRGSRHGMTCLTTFQDVWLCMGSWLSWQTVWRCQQFSTSTCRRFPRFLEPWAMMMLRVVTFRALPRKSALTKQHFLVKDAICIPNVFGYCRLLIVWCLWQRKTEWRNIRILLCLACSKEKQPWEKMQYIKSKTCITSQAFCEMRVCRLDHFCWCYTFHDKQLSNCSTGSRNPIS